MRSRGSIPAIEQQFEDSLVGHLRGRTQEPPEPRRLSPLQIARAWAKAKKRVPHGQRKPYSTARTSKKSNLIYAGPDPRGLVDSINRQMREGAPKSFVPKFIVRKRGGQDPEIAGEAPV